MLLLLVAGSGKVKNTCAWLMDISQGSLFFFQNRIRDLSPTGGNFGYLPVWSKFHLINYRAATLRDETLLGDFSLILEQNIFKQLITPGFVWVSFTASGYEKALFVKTSARSFRLDLV